jgi:hypothetical protein
MAKRSGTAEVMLGAAPGGPFSVEDVQHGWHVHAWIELRDGIPQITELRLRSAAGSTLRSAHRGEDKAPLMDYPFKEGRKVRAGGITTDVLRSVSTPALFEAIGRDAPDLLRLSGIDPDQDFLALRRPGRRGRDDIFYAAWAERYVTVCASTPRPYAVLVRDHPDYQERAIRDFVNKARNRGLLVGGSPGRAGGKLSAKAERLLDQMKGDSE